MDWGSTGWTKTEPILPVSYLMSVKLYGSKFTYTIFSPIKIYFKNFMTNFITALSLPLGSIRVLIVLIIFGCYITLRYRFGGIFSWFDIALGLFEVTLALVSPPLSRRHSLFDI